MRRDRRAVGKRFAEDFRQLRQVVDDVRRDPELVVARSQVFCNLAGVSRFIVARVVKCDAERFDWSELSGAEGDDARIDSAR